MTARKTIVRKAPDRARVLSDVEAAMRSLPLASWPATNKDGKKIRITSDHVTREPIIVELAEKYWDLIDAQDTPPARKSVQALFAKIEKQADDLRQSLIGLGRHNKHACVALQTAMNDPTWTPAELFKQLEELASALGRAEVPTAKSRKGPAQDPRELQIALAAWADYRQLTGKPLSQTRDCGGGFPAFLGKILRALGRTDSAENLAKAVARISEK